MLVSRLDLDHVVMQSASHWIFLLPHTILLLLSMLLYICGFLVRGWEASDTLDDDH
jgi:hypothetical protein